MAGEWDVVSVAPVDQAVEQPSPVGEWDVVGVAELDPGDRVRLKMDNLDRSIGTIAKDIAVKAASGANAMVGNVADIYGLATGDMDNPVSEQAKSGQAYWEKQVSPQLKSQEANRRAAIDAADGEWAKAGTAIWETLKNPALLSSSLAEQAAQLVPMAGAGRAAGLAAEALGAGAGVAGGAAVAGGVGAGAAMQGADTGGDAYDRLMALPDPAWAQNQDVQALMAQGMPLSEAKQRVATSLSRDSAALAAIASGALNLIPGARVLEKSLAGIPAKGAIAGRVASGLIGEGAQEGLEEGSGMVAQNRAVQAVDPNQSLTQGAGEAAGLGAVVGGPMGGMAGIAGGHEPNSGTVPPNAGNEPSVEDMTGEPLSTPSTSEVQVDSLQGIPQEDGSTLVPGTESTLSPADRRIREIRDAVNAGRPVPPGPRGQAQEVPVEDVELAPPLPQSDLASATDELAGNMRQTVPANIDVNEQAMPVENVELAPPPVEKLEPWQMTREEFADEAAFQGVNAATDESNPSYWFTDQSEEARTFAEGERGDGKQPNRVEPRIDIAYKSDLDAEWKDSERPTGSRHAYTGGKKNRPVRASVPLSAANDPHRHLVEQAIKEGKDVPANVLAQYPDLAPASNIDVNDVEEIDAAPAPQPQRALPPPAMAVDSEGNAQPQAQAEQARRAFTQKERLQYEQMKKRAAKLEAQGDTEGAIAIRRKMVGLEQQTVVQPVKALPAPVMAVDSQGNAALQSERDNAAARQQAEAADIERRATELERAGKTEEAIAIRREAIGYTQPEGDNARADRSRAERLPPNWTDNRLARAPYRYGIRGMAEDLVKGGDISYTRDENDKINGRTPSVNPEWFKAMNANPDTSMSTEAVKVAVEKALAGKPLGVREARVVGAMIDTFHGERGEQVDYAKGQLEAARKFRKTAAEAIGITDEDVERAGELFNEREYRADWDGPTRSLYELADEAKAVDPVAAQSILESSASDSVVARQLAEVIHGRTQRNQEANPGETQAGRETQAPPTAQVAEEARAPGPESGAITPYTAADLEARDQQKRDGDKARQQSEQRAQADDQRGSFTLTGSDRTADEAAARGQDSLFEPKGDYKTGTERAAEGQAAESRRQKRIREYNLRDYSAMPKDIRKIVDRIIDKADNPKQLRRNLRKMKGTPWSVQALDGALVRAAIEEAAAGRDPTWMSALDSNPTLKDALKAAGAEAAFVYLQDAKKHGVIGSPSKPELAVNSSFLNCDPSKGCAEFCYATGGNYQYEPNILKGELVNFAVTSNPRRIAKMAAKQYLAMDESKAGKALRLFDKGDGAMEWLPFIEEMNKAGVRLHIFSKQPEFLRKVDPMNVRLLSVDSTNTQKAYDNPDLPVAYVFTGRSDIQHVVAMADRLQLILPVQGKGLEAGGRTWREIPQDVRKGKVCPIDGSVEKVTFRERIGNTVVSKDWNCTHCDNRGLGIGCYHGQTTKAVLGRVETRNQRPDKLVLPEHLKELMEYIDNGKGLSAAARERLRASVAALTADLRSGTDPGAEAAERGTILGSDDGVGRSSGQAGRDGSARSGDEVESPRNKYGISGAQLDLFPAAERSAHRESRVALDELLRRNQGTVFGNAIARDFEARGYSDLVGKKIRTPRDLALAAQIYRDPRFETLRYFFTDGNDRIIYQTGVTSRMPGMATIGPSGWSVDEWLKKLMDDASGIGAIKVWMLHNHPSGNAEPSTADIRVTQRVADIASDSGLELASHVVIDTNQYAQFDAKAARRAMNAETSPRSFVREAKLGKQAYDVSQAKTPHALLGSVVEDPRQVADIAKRVSTSESGIVLIGVGGGNRGVTYLGEIAPEHLTGPRGGAIIHRIMVTSGSIDMFAANVPQKLASRAAAAVDEGFLRDAIVQAESGEGMSVHSMGLTNYTRRDIKKTSKSVKEDQADYYTDETDKGVGMFAARQSRDAHRWTRVTDTPNGPLFQGDGFTLFPAYAYPNIWQTTGYLILDEDGQRAGEVTLRTDNGQVTDLYWIGAHKKGAGLGRRVMAGITASNDGPIAIHSVLPTARKFWDKIGAYDYVGEEKPDATLDWEAYQRAARGSDELASEDGEGRAAQSDSRNAGTPRQGLTPESVQTYLETKVGPKVVKRLLDSGRLKILASDSTELPADVKSAIGEGDMVFGYTENGVTYLIADNLNDKGAATKTSEDAYAILLHETGVHYGMPAMLGDKLFSSVIAEAKAATGKLGEAWAAARKMVPRGTNPAHVDEETLAWMVTDRANHELSLVKRVLAKIRAWLVSKGFTKAMDADSLVELARGAATKAGGQTQGRFARRVSEMFYSQAMKAIEGAKQAKATGEQWLAEIRKSGTKQEEIEWLGLDELLADAKSVTRDELAAHVRANQVEVTEVAKGGQAVTDAQALKVRYHLIDHAGMTDFEARHLVDRARTGDEDAIGDLEQTVAPGTYDEFMKPFHERPATRYQQYQTPGGENYRELLLTLPSTDKPIYEYVAIGRYPRTFDNEADAQKYVDRVNRAMTTEPDFSHEADHFREHPMVVRKQKAANSPITDYHTGHFDEPNILAHIRFNERTDADGKRVLFVEEVQSDWHQAGRKQGYKDLALKRRLDEKSNRGESLTSDEMDAYNDNVNDAVPNAPFKQSWPLLAMKRVIRWAAENDFDRVAWTTGDMQAERYHLSKQVRSIDVVPRTDARTNEKTKSVRIELINGNPFDLGVDKDGMVDNGEYKGKNLSDVVGKEMADKIMSAERATFSGDDLKIGGEGMKGFYDKILPNEVNKYIKKWGGRVGQANIEGDTYAGRKKYEGPNYSLEEARKMLKNFRTNEEQDLVLQMTGVITLMKTGKSFQYAIEEVGSFHLAVEVGGKLNVDPKIMSVHGFDLTDAMRDAAMQGQPMFARRAANTDAFKRWFGDSKVVDKDGEPLVVYHGTSSSFDVFDKSWTELSPRSDQSGLGFFFTEEKQLADHYAGRRTGANVVPVYLSISNPYVAENRQDSVWQKATNSRSDAKRVRSELEAKGYDGFITPDDEYVAFSPTQIKSATGNNGNFDPNESDIRFARRAADDIATAVDSPAIKKRLNMKERARAVVNAIDAKITPLATMAGRTEYLTSRYLTLGRIAQTQQEARRVYDMFRKLSDADGQKVYAYLTDTEGTLEGVDALTKANATRVKKMIEQTGQMLVERGIIPIESFQKYEGRYLPRVYLAYLLGDKAVAAVGAGKTLSQQGYAKSRDETLPHEYRDLVLGEIKDPAFLASRALGIPLRDIAILNWLSKIAQNPDWVLPGQTVEWKMPGFDNTRTVTPYWLKSEATSLRERAQFYQGQNKADAMQLAAQMDEAADAALSEAGIALDQVPDGYKQVPNSARYGAVRGLIVVKDIYDDIVGVGRVVSNDASLAENILGYGGVGSKITGYWKWAKVAANPPAQVRNVISNMVLLQLSGVPMHKLPGLIARAAKEVRTKGKFYQVGLKYGVTESTFAAQEMQRIERETANYLARMGGRFSLAHLKDYFGRFQDWTGDMYQASEMLGKVVKIMDSMEREGKSEGEAAMAAQEWLFDYSLVGQNVRYLRSAPIGAPFLTFAIKVLPRILEVAITHPARFLPYAGMLYASSLLVQSLTGADDDDLDKLKKALPEWLQENGHVMMLPVKDEHGRWQFVDVGYFFPWTYWTGLASDLGGAVKDLVTKGETDKLGKAMTGSGLLGGPIPDMLTAIKTGKDSFTGRDIIDDHMTAGEKLNAMLTYLYGMAMPPFLTGIPPFHDHATSKGAAGHIYEALTGTTDKRGEPRSTVPQAMMRLVGVNVYGIEPEKARQRSILFKTYEISKTVQLMRSIAKDRSIDKDDKPELIAAYKTKINRMKEDLDTYKKESVVAPELR